jgi:hypothetical protein
MELKPSQDKQGSRTPSKMLGVGAVVTKSGEGWMNPFGVLARGLEPRGPKRRRWASETLGTTPPRDGPFAFSAVPVARNFPPKSRQRGNP